MIRLRTCRCKTLAWRRASAFPYVLAVVGLILCLVGVRQSPAAESHTLHSFQRVRLTDLFFAEGAAYADLNRDGIQDVVVGPYWYAGPEYDEQFEIYAPQPFHIDGYSENFLSFAHDVNEDGWPDVLVVGWPGREAHWFENPQGGDEHWEKHVVLDVVDNESPALVDLTGDGRLELVCINGGRYGYAEIPTTDPRQPWQFHPITSDRGYVQYTHGLGVGDVDGDGRADLLEQHGWWEQPDADSERQLWTFHAVEFAAAGGAQMFAYDVDGDGDNDVITGKAAHAYGLSWFEHVADGEAIRFREHPLMGEQPNQNEYGVTFSQLHAFAMVDMDGDGVQDLVTGKRFWAHKDQDPGSLDPAVLYWFQIQRGPDGVRFVPHLIDSNSGVGTQVVAGDVNGDGLPDVVVGNKKGAFVFTHRAEQVDQATWESNQPVVRYPAAEAGPLVGAADRPRRVKTATTIAPASHEADADEELFALADDDRLLNLDFETGDLTDWTASGTAFESQPIQGDTVNMRRGDMRSGHAGDFWVGTYEVSQDGAKGALTSAPFEVRSRYASFLVGGGSHERTAVEIVSQDSGDVLYSARGQNDEQMHRVAVDLQSQLGRKIFIRLVDEVSGGWGHVNFDHFRFHARRPTATVTNPRAPTPDEYSLAGVSAQQAADAMELPEGFSASVFAAEPDVKQPIAMALDDRGRVWVAEAYEYPRRAESEGRDRILIFEDTDGDNRFDSRKVFAEGLNLVSGLEVGFGGVWVGAAPYLLFIPDRDGDDVPDGEPENLLDGWGYEDTHETLNAFIWGPDGWLYGCHGVFTHSRVGRPGTADDQRVPLNAGVWRYHPTRHEFEVFAHGTSNPWGVDFDDHGQAVCTACVIPHLFHMIQGARYQRQAGQHFNQHTYADIQTIADHRHYVGDNPHRGNGVSDDAGGGHAHAGAMIYLGDAWPEQYRGQLLMNNVHGQRVNIDLLERRGSGLVGRHGPDFLLTQDQASQMLNFRYGPDGQVYVIDWYDMQACHLPNVDAHDRSNGRIYKITYGDAQPTRVDLGQLSDLELAKMCLHANDWYVRHSRRILQERSAADSIDDEARRFLVHTALSHDDATRRLRAAWALHAMEEIHPQVVGTLLADSNEYVRGWAVQLALDNQQDAASKLFQRFLTMAANDESQVVRLYLASAATRLPIADRWELVTALSRHGEDADDHNLPLMYWYAAEPLAEADPERALALGLSCAETIPQLREFMIRRIGSLDSSAALAALVSVLGDSQDAGEQLALLNGIRTALRGRRQVAAPADWAATFGRLRKSKIDEIRSQAVALGVTFGDRQALETLRTLARARQENADGRREALEALLAVNDSQLPSTLQSLLDDADVRDLALRGLAQFDDPNTPAAVLDAYPALPPAEKRAALATLCARPAFAVALLNAIPEGRLPVSDLSADLVNQLLRLDDPDVARLVENAWGTVRSTPADKAELIATYKRLLADPDHADADVRLGRAIFTKTCQQCHTLYGVGYDIGPDLTGSNRSDIDYLLSNIVDPSAMIAKEYQSTMILTDSGRTVTGVVSAEDERSVTIRNATENLIIPKDEIELRELTPESIMPGDQLKQFSDQDVAALFAYLRSKSQSPMLATQENAGLLFSGRDLAGWRGDEALWSVEEGEIVGRSPGIDHNSFLISDMAAEDFRLSLEVKLVDNVGNSGVQFRSEPVHGFEEVRGYQADVGVDWWGKLYEENGRALLWEQSGERHVKSGEWNQYEILAQGDRIRTWINGQLCVDLDDPAGRKEGVFALQLHSGGPTEVRFRNLKLEVIGD